MEHGGDIYGNKNIELDFSVNLSPIGPPREVVREIRSISDDGLQKLIMSYPDPSYRELRHALARKLESPEEWIVCGNGASELLMAATQAVRPERAMIPVPTYQGYERVLEAAGAEILFYELTGEQGFALTGEFMESAEGIRRLAETGAETGWNTESGVESDSEPAAEPASEAMLFLCNPNNPSGKCIEPALLKEIARYCKANRIFLVVDECYLELLEDARFRTMRHSVAENPYLVIVGAFTKTYAMPGIRLGYLLTSNSELRKEVRLRQPEWSISMTAQRAGIAALDASDYLSEARQAVQAEREYVCRELRELGMDVMEGEAPFVMFRSEKELYEPLKEKGILIRRCDGIRGVRGGSEGGYYYRIGLRRREDNRRLMKEIGDLLR